jgi:hypothetical protein
MKKLLLGLLILGSFSSFANSVCKSKIYVDIPADPYVDTRQLDDTYKIYSKIDSKGYAESDTRDFTVRVDSGYYQRRKIVMGGAAVRYDDYVYSEITVIDKNGKERFQDLKEKSISADANSSMERIILMRKHIKSLPKCEKL